MKEMLLARNGKAGCEIALDRDASPPEKRAAEELAKFLKEATGAAFAVRNAADARTMPCIAVGPGAARLLKADLPLDGLGADGILIRAAPPNLILTGGDKAPRGTLYAVYTFLEDFAGCRWWTKTESSIPRRPDLAVPASLDVRYVPPLERRDQCFVEGFDKDWSVRMKYNGWTGPGDDESRGGTMAYAGAMCHTFEWLAPPKEHFAKHPDWFSERDGKRIADRSQLCLTNPELLAFVIERCKEWIRKQPKAAYVSVTQNDWDNHCLCAKCRALEDEEGSPAGPMIRFVNAVAEALEPEFPNIAVDTFAYQYTRKPPKFAKPRKNVVVRLCSIECSFAQPLEHEKNRKFREDIEGWAKICDRLYVWDYVTNFSNYVQPHPNLRVLGPNVRFFVRNHVKGLFEQGNYQSLCGEMGALRAWVLGKLLWNPDLDEKALIDEFVSGYFEKAGPIVRRYIDLLHDRVAATDYYMQCYVHPTAPFLDYATMRKAEDFFQQAEKAVADRPDVLRRVRIAHLPVRYVFIHRWPHLKLATALAKDEWTLPSSRIEAIAEFEKVCAEGKATLLSEPGYKVEWLRRDFGDNRRETASPPPGFENLKGSEWVDLQDDLFGLWQRGKLCDLKDDAKASDGMAAWMPGTHREWALGLRLDELGLDLAGDWTAYAVVRVEKKGETGPAFTCGLYDWTNKKGVLEIAAPAADVKDAEYRAHRIGGFTYSPGLGFWIAPPANGETVEAVWIDRFFLVKGKGK